MPVEMTDKIRSMAESHLRCLLETILHCPYRGIMYSFCEGEGKGIVCYL